MEMATSSDEFSFDDIMHHQIDEVAIESFPGLALANTFVGYHEYKLFQTTFQPEMYYCYMDDTFVVFSKEKKCDIFLHICLNSLHYSLHFAFEKECNLGFLF